MPDMPPQPAASPQRIRRALLAGVMALALLALTLELGARVLVRWAIPPTQEAPIKAHDLSALDATFRPDPHVWWLLKPGLKDYPIKGRCWGRDVEFRFSTNTAGYRCAEVGEKGTRKRVLALGDSVTFGLGVGDEETWPQRLQERLNAQAGSDAFQVVNMGVPGYSAFQGLRLLDKQGLALEPDVVLACFGQNDFDLWNTQTDLEKARAESENMAIENASPSDLFVLARRAVQGAGQAMADPNAPKQPRLTREEFRDTLEQMRQLCAEREIPLLILRWPQEGQVLGKNPAPMNYEDIVLALGNDAETTLVDLHPAFAAKTVPLYADPVHGNAAGCDAAAEALVAPVMAALGDKP